MAKDHNGITDLDLCGFDGRDTVAQRLKAGGFTVGNAVVDFHKSNFRQDRDLGETAGQVETDDGPLAAEVAPFGTAERTFSARQFGARRDSIADLKATDAAPRLHNPSTELVPKKLNGGLGFESALHAVECQGWNAKRELRLGDARLNAERLNQDVAGKAFRNRDFIEAHVAETVKSPGFHRWWILVKND